jgi:tRNA (uracil-5-)-methyltransferase
MYIFNNYKANTKAAEILYNKIVEISDIDENTIVLDICCGTGTIGLSLAKKAKHIVGVEIIPEAIEDAKINSDFNEIKNVEWICGKAEDILPKIFRRFENEKIIAIVDPPRAGLHSKVIQTLRRLKNLDKLIYVSCNPELAFGNFIE